MRLLKIYVTILRRHQPINLTLPCTFFTHLFNVFLFAKTSTLCERYGKPIHTQNSHTYYDFPLLSSLSHASLESELRDLGFGYRAKYIAETAKLLEKRGEEWLMGLRTCGYEEAKELLTQLPGVSVEEAYIFGAWGI